MDQYMSFEQIKAFLAAAECGSFRRAAEVLNGTQPSVSARIHALESELGVPLFHRMPRGVRLTQMGQVFLPYAQRCMGSLREGREMLDSARHASAGVLSIAVARAVGTYVLPGILRRFREQYPGINVRIKVGRSSEVLQMVISEEVQLGIARFLQHPDVNEIHLYDEEIVLVTNIDHPFAQRGEATIQEVAQEPLILYDRGSAYFIAINQACQQAGIVPRVEMDLDSIEATKHMVELGMGISFLPRSGVNQETGNGTLTIIPVTGLDPIYLPTCVLLRRAQHYSPPVLSLLKLLRDIYGEDIPIPMEKGP